MASHWTFSLCASGVLLLLGSVGRAEFISPQTHPMQGAAVETHGPPYPAFHRGHFGPGLTDEYKKYGLHFGDPKAPRAAGPVTALALFGANYDRVAWVGAQQSFYTFSWPDPDTGEWQWEPGNGLWYTEVDLGPVQASLSTPANTLRASFIWDGLEGTASLTGYTSDGREVTATASNDGGAAPLVVSAPDIVRFTASGTGVWGVSGVEALPSATPEPGALCLALIGGVTAYFLRRKSAR